MAGPDARKYLDDFESDVDESIADAEDQSAKIALSYAPKDAVVSQ